MLDILENYEELNDKIHEVAGLDLSGYYLFNIKIKPLTSLERKLLCDILNNLNDKDIAYACDAYVKVEDVEETNTLLQLLIEKLVADQEDNSRGE